MDLIIKPTQACNFKCTFCSSCNIDEEHHQLPAEAVIRFLDEHDVNTVIVNGGDPLMMPPSYYEKILEHIDSKCMKTTLSFTTNLWDFYLHPDKWTSLFKRDNVYVATSFQYGEGRRLGNGAPFTEEIFLKVMEKFKAAIGYTPMFISVITHDNDDVVIKTVELAKRLGTTCKINPAMKSGRNDYFYPIPMTIEKYLEIIDNGLAEYEHNAKELSRIMHEQPTICPFNRECYSSIRCMGPQGELFTCGAMHDNSIARREQGKKDYALDKYPEDEIAKDFRYIKPQCLGCSMFKLCNGCYKQTLDIVESGYQEEHCRAMKALESRLLAL